MEDWDSFLRSLKIAISVLQKMESATCICKGGKTRNVFLFKGTKSQQRTNVCLTPHLLPYHNAINKVLVLVHRGLKAAPNSVLSWELI